MTTDFSALAASFGFGGTSADVLRSFKNFVTYFNHHGGLAGHPIVGDFYYLSGTSADPATAFQTACTHFTQDQHDQLVITDGEYNPTFESCLAHAGVPHFDAAKYGLDAVAQHQTPNYLAPISFGVDRYTRAQIEASIAKGWIKRGDKVGVLVEGCPTNVRTYKNVWVPLAQHYGFQLVTTQIVCSTSGDLAGGTTQIESAELRFRSAGVKAISFISAGDGFMAVLLALSAQLQGWHPALLMSSVSTPERGVESQSSGGLSLPAGQLAQIRGVGWLPMTDTGGRGAPTSAAQRAQQHRCAQMDPSRGDSSRAPDPGVRLDFIAHFLMDCDTMLIVDKILQADGGSLALPRILDVYDEVLASYTAASNLGGKLRRVGDRTDGGFVVAPYAYESHCSCVRYVGPPRPVG
jgi:hypothetical protein